MWVVGGIMCGVSGVQGRRLDVMRRAEHGADEFEDVEIGRALWKLGVTVENGLGPDGASVQ
jgi:hypothetical protein